MGILQVTAGNKETGTLIAVNVNVNVVMKCCIFVLQRLVSVIRMLVIHAQCAHPPFDASLQLMTGVTVVM